MKINPGYNSNEEDTCGDMPYINIPEWQAELAEGDWLLFEQLSGIPFYVKARRKGFVVCGHPSRPVDDTISFSDESIAIMGGKYCGRTRKRNWLRWLPFVNAHPYPLPY